MCGCQFTELEENDWSSWSQAKNSTFQTEFRQLRRSEAWYFLDTEWSFGERTYVSQVWGRDLEETLSLFCEHLCHGVLTFTPEGPLAGASGARWPPAVQGCPLPLPAGTVSLEGTREDILLLLLWVARVPHNDQHLSLIMGRSLPLSSPFFFWMSTSPDPWGSDLLRVPPGYSAAKFSIWESIPSIHAYQTLMYLLNTCWGLLSFYLSQVIKMLLTRVWSTRT